MNEGKIIIIIMIIIYTTRREWKRDKRQEIRETKEMRQETRVNK